MASRWYLNLQYNNAESRYNEAKRKLEEYNKIKNGITGSNVSSHLQDAQKFASTASQNMAGSYESTNISDLMEDLSNESSDIGDLITDLNDVIEDVDKKITKLTEDMSDAQSDMNSYANQLANLDDDDD